MQRNFSQAAPSIQNIQNQAAAMASSCRASGFAAIVHEPTAYHYDVDAYSCAARRLGTYPTHAAAVSACLSFIAAIAGDDFKAWASYQVVPAV
ncbi:TPA: hypothetical protein ACFRG8_001247 [Neisseria lactamica]|uniref:hypothetical protein n=1 Tax=Neisseria lactamica TaxID=486 RepID=UPI0002E135E5|nr:hypothetical protein [Neisseria lactamica]